ncbi:uncharacterized protein BKA55DRAFT_568931, partial [Fusarium redolens]
MFSSFLLHAAAFLARSWILAILCVARDPGDQQSITRTDVQGIGVEGHKFWNLSMPLACKLFRCIHRLARWCEEEAVNICVDSLGEVLSFGVGMLP